MGRGQPFPSRPSQLSNTQGLSEGGPQNGRRSQAIGQPSLTPTLSGSHRQRVEVVI